MNFKIKISKEYILIFLLFHAIPVFDTFALLINKYFPILIFSRTIVFFLGILIVMCSRFIPRGVKYLFLFFIFYFILSIFMHSSLFSTDAISEISSFIKLLYFPVSFFSLYVLFKEGKIGTKDIERVLFRYATLIFISLFLGYISGYGGKIGGRGVNIKSMKGFMIGANEVGLMLILTIPFFAVRLEKKMSFFKTNFLTVFLSAFAGVLVFTKSSLIAIFVPVFYFIRNLKKVSFFKRIFIKSSLALIFFLGSMRLYENLEGIIDFMTTSFFSSLLEGDYVGFFFRGRQTYIEAIYPQLVNNSYNWLIFLFGVGEYYIRNISEIPLSLQAGRGTLFEMDFFDLFAMYGVLGFTLYLLFIFFIIKKTRITNFKLLFLLLFLHSFMAGHVLFSPQVTTLVSFILIFNIKKI